MISADPVDAASDIEQNFLELSIKRNSQCVKRNPKQLGKCDYCGEPTLNTLLFCSTECRDEDQIERRLLAINGKF